MFGGEKVKLPSYSQGICESVTAGYGKFDEYGFWEYPLNVLYTEDGVVITEETIQMFDANARYIPAGKKFLVEAHVINLNYKTYRKLLNEGNIYAL